MQQPWDTFITYTMTITVGFNWNDGMYHDHNHKTICEFVQGGHKKDGLFYNLGARVFISKDGWGHKLLGF